MTQAISQHLQPPNPLSHFWHGKPQGLFSQLMLLTQIGHLNSLDRGQSKRRTENWMRYKRVDMITRYRDNKD